MSTVLLALFDDYQIAERVREVLVQDGFPTDRVELTASCEMGRASLEPADSPHGKCVQYFRALFESEDDRDYPEMLAQRIENGAAAVTVLPRGTIETERATQILQHAHPADVLSRGLTEHGWEHAAARRERAWAQHVWFEHSANDPDCIYCRVFPEHAFRAAPHRSAMEPGSGFTPAVGPHFAAAPAASIPARTPEFLHIGIRRVRALQSLEWLRSGWDDLWNIRLPSLMHGILIAALGVVLLTVGGSHPYFVVAAISGYVLVGPIMATGLCELSRRRARGEPMGFDESLQGVMRNPQALLKFGAILAAVTFIWFVASEVMLRSVLQISGPTTGEMLWGGFTETASRAQIIAYVSSGAVLAALVFAVSVVSVPLIIDRQASATEAVWGSLKATLSNIPAMLLWSALIVGLTSIGFLTLLFGMVIVAPLLGHATWHAYRELVE